ncbi:MAG: hypothetical protein WCE61_14455 [Candidatus Acidiferrum sp.]
MKVTPATSSCREWLARTAFATTLALSLSGLAFAQQDQPPPDQPVQSQDQVPPPSQQQPPPPAQNADRHPQTLQAQQQSPQAPPAPPQDTNRPPITSVDRMPQSSPQYSPQDQQQNAPRDVQQNGQQNPGVSLPQNPPNENLAPPPALLTIPAGTVVVMRLNNFLSSDHNHIGDQFSGVLEQPIVVNGWVVARRGQVVMGQVKSVKKAGRIKGTSQLGIELTDIVLVNGQQAPILTKLWQASRGTTHGADATTIGGTTALGALIGSAADWGTGAAIGAGAGAAAGIGAVLLTRGRPTILDPESQLSFRLEDPVKVDTTNGQQAFLPVSQQDFGPHRSARPRLPMRSGYYGYPGYASGPCGYGYPSPCYYSPGYVGIYPSFGWWGGGFYGRGWHGGRGYRRH